MQGYVDAGFQKANRQPEDESPSMDRLSLAFRTEHVGSANFMGMQGVYVLTDNSFKSFSRMSMASSSEAVHRAQPVGRASSAMVPGLLAC